MHQHRLDESFRFPITYRADQALAEAIVRYLEGVLAGRVKVVQRLRLHLRGRVLTLQALHRRLQINCAPKHTDE